MTGKRDNVTSRARAERTPRARHNAKPRRPWQEGVTDLCAHILDGVPLEPACVLAGVSFGAVQEAMRREDPEAEPIHAARAKREAELAKKLEDLATDGRQHAGIAYLLERHAPTRWRQSSKVELSGPDGGPVQSQAMTPPTEAELRARLEAVRKKLEQP